MKVVEKQLARPRDQRANASRMNEFNLNMFVNTLFQILLYTISV
jgi:hypothetical protein